MFTFSSVVDMIFLLLKGQIATGWKQTAAALLLFTGFSLFAVENVFNPPTGYFRVENGLQERSNMLFILFGEKKSRKRPGALGL